jgi:hypothetical protein
MPNFNATQELIFDRGAAAVHPILRITGAVDLYLSFTSAPLSPYSTGTPVLDYASKAVPCVTRMSETTYGFSSYGMNSPDEIQSMVIECVNATIPVNSLPSNVPQEIVRGKLSDYLALICTIQGPPAWYDFPPGFASVYYVPLTPASYDAASYRWYIFRGVVSRFQVLDGGRNLLIYLTSDQRWNRPNPYPLNRKNYKECPQENVGQNEPLLYGDFGLWAHRQFPATGAYPNGPFSIGSPIFPICLNAAPVPKVLRLANSSTGWESGYSLGTGDPAGIGGIRNAGVEIFSSAQGTRFQAMALGDAGQMGLISPDSQHLYMQNRALAVSEVPTIPTTDDGRRDQKRWNAVLLKNTVRAHTVVLPVRELASESVGSHVNNLSSIFASIHRDRSAQHMIDGDRFSYFKDNVNGTTHRKVIYELPAMPNMGAISNIYVTLAARLRGPAGDALYWRAKLYWANSVQVGNPRDTFDQYIWPWSGGTEDYGYAKEEITGLMDYAPHVEQWNFTQLDTGAPAGGQGMRLVFEWWRSGGSGITVFDLYQIALVIYYNPLMSFTGNRVITRDMGTIRTYRPNGTRGKDRVVRRDILQKTMESRGELGDAFYVGLGEALPIGFGMVGSPGWDGDPLNGSEYPQGYPYVIDQPADIVHHLIWSKGGAQLSEVNSLWPKVSNEAFERVPNVPQSFETTRVAMNAAVQESTGTTRFRVAFGLPYWPDVRTAVRAFLEGMPGLHFLELPCAATNPSGSDFFGSFGLYWAMPNTTYGVYRKEINIERDCVDFSWEITPVEDVVNDLKLNYGYSAWKGSYCRRLWVGDSVFEHGWPFNTRNSGSEEHEVVDLLAASILPAMLDSSYTKYGHRPNVEIDLPWVYRWQEAITIRNWFLRWFSHQRVRLMMTMKITTADLLPGDVFYLQGSVSNPETDFYLGHRFPLAQFPITDSESWQNKKFMVERVTPIVGDDGALLVRVQAIFFGKIAET